MASDLRILSWNVLFTNKRHDEILEYIRNVDADFVCLQEVTDTLLERLHALPYQLASGVDVIFTTDAWHPEKGETTTHVVVLSKFPILETQRQKFPVYPPEHLRMKFFNIVQYITGIWRGGRSHGKESVSVDVEVEGQRVRVFSVHLALLTPQIRLAEFAVVADALLPDGANIVAGDFNILESAYIKVWNWMRGGRLRDAMPWANERIKIEKQFIASGLQNPLRGCVTHPISDSQLDHVLVPAGARVLERKVSRKKYGSDHAPVEVLVRL